MTYIYSMKSVPLARARPRRRHCRRGRGAARRTDARARSRRAFALTLYYITLHCITLHYITLHETGRGLVEPPRRADGGGREGRGRRQHVGPTHPMRARQQVRARVCVRRVCVVFVCASRGGSCASRCEVRRWGVAARSDLGDLSIELLLPFWSISFIRFG